MNEPMTYWVCVWNNSRPTLNPDRETAMERILASGVDISDIEDLNDPEFIYVDDWVIAYLTPLS